MAGREQPHPCARCERVTRNARFCSLRCAAIVINAEAPKKKRAPVAAGMDARLFRESESASRHELKKRDWFTLQGRPDEPAPTPKAFAKLVRTLRVRKWDRANPAKRAAIRKRYFAQPAKVENHLARARVRRLEKHRAAAPVITCQDCGAEFCLIKPTRGGTPKRFCGPPCADRAYYRRRLDSHADEVQEEERRIGNAEAAGSMPVVSSIENSY